MNCDPIARWYRWLEYAAFGGALRRRREAFLFELGDPQTVLVLGDGDGRFLQLFTALYPRARVDAVDVSERMLELARARAPGVTFHLADAREFAFQKQYDLAVAHFFFDCFEQEELAGILARVSTQTWLVSEFRNTRWSWPLVRGLYFFFRLATGLTVTRLPDHPAALQQFGYRLGRQQEGLGGMVVSELWVLRAAANHVTGSVIAPSVRAGILPAMVTTNDASPKTRGLLCGSLPAPPA